MSNRPYEEKSRNAVDRINARIDKLRRPPISPQDFNQNLQTMMDNLSSFSDSIGGTPQDVTRRQNAISGICDKQLANARACRLSRG